VIFFVNEIIPIYGDCVKCKEKICALKKAWKKSIDKIREEDYIVTIKSIILIMRIPR